MPAKFSDKIRLFLSLAAASPILFTVAIIIGIGYPLHVVRSAIMQKMPSTKAGT